MGRDVNVVNPLTRDYEWFFSTVLLPVALATMPWFLLWLFGHPVSRAFGEALGSGALMLCAGTIFMSFHREVEFSVAPNDVEKQLTPLAPMLHAALLPIAVIAIALSAAMVVHPDNFTKEQMANSRLMVCAGLSCVMAFCACALGWYFSRLRRARRQS